MLEIAPVRVGFGHMPANDEMVFSFAQRNRSVRCERSIGRGGYENRERVRPHERDCVGVLTDAEMFRDVHD